MDLQQIRIRLMMLFAFVAVGAGSVSGAYDPDYTVSDIDDIVIDIVGTVMVNLIGEIPSLVDLGVLYIIISLLLMVAVGLVALFFVVPKALKSKKKKF